MWWKFIDESRPLDRAIVDTLRHLVEPGGRERSDLHNDLGVLLLRFGFEKDAENEIRLAIRHDRENAVAWFNLGLIEELTGDTRNALSAFSRCLDLRPGHADALFHVGLIHERAGRREAAIAAYGKAYRHEPRLLSPRYNPQILDTKLLAVTLAASGPQRSLAKSMPMQVMDGARIGGILSSSDVPAEPPPPAPVPTERKIGPQDIDPSHRGAVGVPAPRGDSGRPRERMMPPPVDSEEPGGVMTEGPVEPEPPPQPRIKQ